MLFAAALSAPIPAVFVAASCSLQGLADSPQASSSSSSGQGGAGAKLAYEAEDAALYGKFTTGKDPAASGGEYVFVPAGAGCSDGLSEVIFDVTVSAAGKYHLWATVSADSGLHDSFLVSVDGASPAVFSVPDKGSFVEEAVDDSSAAVKAPIVYALSAGAHHIVFRCREDGASLDKIRIEEAPP